MPEKKRRHEEHVDETWLLPYSDLLTLLLALFIVMFSISNLDKEKFKKISEQFSVIFSGGSGVLNEGGAAAISLKSSGAGGLSLQNIEENQMMKIKDSIEREIRDNGYQDKIKVNLNNEGLEISIQELVLFNSGEAEVLNSVTPMLLHVAKILNALDNHIKVTGHTDNVPIRNGKFRSNWDLSAMRAINVMTFLVEQGGLQPERFSIQGYSQYAPKYDNTTAAGRAKNRRVEIFLVRKYPVIPKQEIGSENPVQ